MDHTMASKHSQRAELGRLVALACMERIAKMSYDPGRELYTLSSLQESKQGRLIFSGREPFWSEASTEVDGLLVPTLMIESDIKLGSYVYQRQNESKTSWVTVSDDVQAHSFIHVLREWNDWDERMTKGFAARLFNSQQNLAKAYRKQRPSPTLESDFITWEQSVVDGNMHPLHKCRMPMSKDQPSPAGFNLDKPKIAFLAAKRSHLKMQGDLDLEMQPLLRAAGLHDFQIDESEVIVPVHEFQVETLLASDEGKAHLRLLPKQISGFAQSSTRTITVPAVPELGVKLALSMIIGDVDRQIKPDLAALAITLSASDILNPKYVDGLKIPTLELIPEVACAVGFDRRLGVVLRRGPSNTHEVSYIMSGALGELATVGEAACVAEPAFGLRDLDARLDFFTRYSELYLRTFMSPLLVNGLLFYAHGQNAVLKVSKSSKDLLGFAYRDIGDIRMNVSSFESSTGLQVEQSTMSSEWRSVEIPELLQIAHRVFFLVHLIPLMVVLRIDHRVVKPRSDTPEGERRDGMAIIVRLVDSILREYAANSDSSPKGEVIRNIAKQARYVWLEKRKFHLQGVVSMRMRPDLEGLHRLDTANRIETPNPLAQVYASLQQSSN